MKTISTQTLNQIVNHFVDLYKEEIEENAVDGDCINGWWIQTIDQYYDEIESDGFDFDDDDDYEEVYNQIEKAIFKAI